MNDAPTKVPGWRFSILDLLMATGVLAVAAAPIQWLGPHYTACAVVSLLLLAAVGYILARRGWTWSLLPCLLAFLISGPLFSLSLAMQAAGTFLVCVATASWKDRPRARFLACVAVMVFAYVPAFQYAYESDRRVDQLREAYPIVSIRDRLPGVPDAKLRPVSLTPEQDKTLAAVEDEPGWRSYSSELRRLHSDSYKRFARSPGFGFMRMGPITTGRIDRELQSVLGEPVRLPSRLNRSADQATPAEIHASARGGFLDPDRLGYVEEAPDRVAGFQTHGLARLPYDDRWQDRPERTGAWTLQRLELIGLLGRHEPRAYVSETLPNMEELAGAPTRQLTEFETAAISLLRGKQDLVVEERSEADRLGVSMVGALRAGNRCAECHGVPYGTLLGAFSYELIRETAFNPARSPPSAGG